MLANSLAARALSGPGRRCHRPAALTSAYRGFNLNIPARNGTPDEWALPVTATYVVDRDGAIVYAHTDVDYRDRADPRDVLVVLTRKTVAA